MQAEQVCACGEMSLKVLAIDLPLLQLVRLLLGLGGHVLGLTNGLSVCLAQRRRRVTERGQCSVDRVRRSGRSYAGQEFEVDFFSDAKFDATDFAALVPNQDVSAGRRGLRTGLSLHRAFIHEHIPCCLFF